MAKAELVEVIAEAAYSPEEDRREELIHKYKAAGADGPSTTMQTCMMVFEDDEEGIETKLATIGILDCLMELNGAALAQHLASQGHLKFFKTIAKKLNATDASRLPAGFSPDTHPDEITQFITAVCEFIDKWGRVFESASPPLKDFAKIRKDVAGQSNFPSPESYMFVEPPSSGSPQGFPVQSSASAPGFAAQAPSFATQSGPGGLNEELLQKLIHQVHEARSRYGDGDEKTFMAYASAEEELGKWSEAVFAAAAQEDFIEMERLSEIETRYRAMLDSSDYMPPTDGKKKHSKKHQEDTFGSGFPPSHGGASDPWGMDASSYGFPGDAGNWHDDSGQVSNYSQETGYGRKTSKQLEAEVQSLQRQLDEIYRDGGGKEMMNAQQQISEMESLKLLVVDAKTSLEHLTDVNANLEHELHIARSQLQEARRAAVEAEDRLIENEELLTKQREQLFAQSRNAVILEDKLKHIEDFHGDLHDQLQAKYEQHIAHDLELRRVQQASKKSLNNSEEEDKKPLEKLAQDEMIKNRIGTSTMTGRHAVLRRTTAEVWARTPRATPTDTPVIMRHPLGSATWLEQASASFFNLLVQRKGCIYQDDKMGIEMSCWHIPQGETRPVINFEMVVANLGAHPIHHIKLVAQKVPAAANFELRMQAQSGQNAGNVLWPKKVIKYWGELEALGAFEEWPNACFSYLLGDNLSCKALLRLPIAMTRLLRSASLSKDRFLELWNSTQLAHHEVAFVCYVKEEFLGVGTSWSLAKYLQFGGSLHSLLGLDENPGSVALAALWTEHQDGKPLDVEVLVRVELGSPASPGGRIGVPGVSAHVSRFGTPASAALRQQCRVAIRSTAHHVSKSLAKVILEVIARPDM